MFIAIKQSLTLMYIMKVQQRLWIRVYKNNKIQKENVDYKFKTNVNNVKQIEFIKKLTAGDVIN